MTDSEVPETTGRDHAGRWQPGGSGNPAGRPRGARHEALLALDAIGADNAYEVMRAVVGAARAGDMRAAEILLSRLWPQRKGRPVALDLPALNTAADVSAALAATAAAMAEGTLSPEEAGAVAAVIEAQRRAIETLNLEARIAALEAQG
ncbi:DUF5681 domain-containing protein [Dankookia rubra]|uniref:DUF5681 domain-containing protein n=1 Tax=Dankookia rubra TaxID=1442381 RepID=UPI001F4FA5A6|nr:DUF5681 domain-containing protein [Dankookia rubra]